MSGIRDHRVAATLALACVTSCATAPRTVSRADQSWAFPRRSSAAVVESAPQSGGRMLGHTAAPRVSISASVASYASSRRVRASLRVDDDAYVLVGHLGADGVVRIVFPLEPSDNGFVRGGHSYDVPEFFAGFEDSFRYRAAYDLSLRGFTPASYDSYDGGTGYVFVIASWQPMRFAQFTENERWQSFEVADDQYLRDPRPAIEEFAAYLTGENRDAYTVRYARYYNTYYFPAPVFSGYATYSSYCSDFGSGFSSPYYYGIAARHGLISRYGSLGFPYYRYGNGCYSPYTLPRQSYQPRIAAAVPSNPYSDGRPRTPAPRAPAQPHGTPLYPRTVGPDDANAGAPGVDFRRRDLTVPDATEPSRRAAPREPALREAPTAVNRPAVQEPASRPRMRAIDPDERQAGVERQPSRPRERTTEAQSAAPRTEPRPEPRESPRAAPREPASREPRTERHEVPRERAAEPKSEPAKSAPPAAPPRTRPPG